MSPVVASSSPAIRRSSVDLPHPDGPTKTTNSPSGTSRLASRITSTASKAFERPFSWRLAMGSRVQMSFDAGRGDAGRDVALQEDEAHGERQGREGRHREEHPV